MMTVRELINKLLDCKMDAPVNVLVEIDKDTIKNILNEYGNYTYPFDDDVAVADVTDYGTTEVRILLEEIKR